MLNKMTTFLISDTHFDHWNIIKYTNRPFKSIDDMNKTIVSNWNSVVAKNDVVYHLGDWGFGREAKPIDYWIPKLNGTIIVVLGSHDKYPYTTQWCRSKDLHLTGYNFLLKHSPYDVSRWKDWVVHGHVHNNKIETFPLINGNNMTINVSAELINYTPISLDYIIGLGLNTIKRWRSIEDEIERF